MGQKVNPVGYRVGVNRQPDSRWFADKKSYGSFAVADEKIRRYVFKLLKQAAIARVIIERPADNKISVNIYSARPGVVIGKKGSDIEKLKNALSRMTGADVSVNITEVRKPELDAKLVAENVANQLERRVAFRRAMKRAVQNALRMGAKGIKVAVAGRLGGAEIARTEWYREGQVPLHTLRADIGYSTAEAHTTYGVIGVKVWICTGEIMEHDPAARDRKWYGSSSVKNA